MSYRVPRKSVNPISITPPSIDIGCGGIDIVGGSFAFAKTDEIVDLFKNVSKQAPYVAASLMMKTLCNECADTVAEIMDYVQKLNNFQLDSCAIAEGAVQAVYEVGSAAKAGELGELKSRAMSSMTSGTSSKYAPAVEEAKKPDTRAKDLEQLKFMVMAYVRDGGSLLDFIYKELPTFGGSGSAFAFPSNIDESKVRALYGDVFYAAGAGYSQVGSCGDKLDAIAHDVPIKENGASTCSSTDSIVGDVLTHFEAVMDAYETGSDVPADTLTTLFKILRKSTLC